MKRQNLFDGTRFICGRDYRYERYHLTRSPVTKWVVQ